MTVIFTKTLQFVSDAEDVDAMLKAREEARVEAGEVEEAREVEEDADEDRADYLLTALRSLIERGIVH